MDGKKISRKSTWAGSVVTNEVYIYAGPNRIAEYSASQFATSPLRQRVFADGIDSLSAIVQSNGAVLIPTRNRQWSIVALTSNSNGSVLERYAYNIYGARTILAPNGTTTRSTSTYTNNYGYTSREHLPESATMYFRARHYDPLSGEFVSRDPLEFVDGMSLYRGYFVPRGMDPTGLCEQVGVTPEGNLIIRVSPECAEGMEGFSPGDCFIWNTTTHTKTRTTCPTVKIPTQDFWNTLCKEKGYLRYLPTSFWTFESLDSNEYKQYLRGCVGVTSCLLGREAFSALRGADCYSTLAAALTRKAEMKKNCSCKGDGARPEIIGHTWRNGNNANFDENCKLSGYQEGANAPGGTRYDFGFFKDGVFYHASDTLSDPSNYVMRSTPNYFHNYHNSVGWQTIYCVVCSGSDPNGK